MTAAENDEPDVPRKPRRRRPVAIPKVKPETAAPVESDGATERTLALVADLDAAGQSKLGRILSRSDLADLPKPTPLIEGWLDLRTAVVMPGATGTNKTFTILGWACSVATGEAWLGHKVCIAPSPVILVVGEGASGLDDRISAWEEEHEVKVPHDRLTVMMLPSSISDAEFWEQLTEYALDQGAKFIGLDTLSSLAPDADEVKDAAMLVRRLTELANAIDGTTVLTHHTGWFAKDRTRGGSQLEANPDGVIVLQKVDEADPASAVQIWRKKDKDGPSGEKVWVRRKPVGGSCVLELADEPASAAGKSSNSAEQRRREAIAQVLKDKEEFTQTHSEVVKAVGGTAAHVRALLDQMIKQREVPTKDVQRLRSNGNPYKVTYLGHVGPIQLRPTVVEGEPE